MRSRRISGLRALGALFSLAALACEITLAARTTRPEDATAPRVLWTLDTGG